MKLAWVNAPLEALYSGQLEGIQPIFTRTDYATQTIHMLVVHEDGVELPEICYLPDSGGREGTDLAVGRAANAGTG